MKLISIQTVQSSALLTNILCDTFGKANFEFVLEDLWNKEEKIGDISLQHCCICEHGWRDVSFISWFVSQVYIRQA